MRWTLRGHQTSVQSSGQVPTAVDISIVLKARASVEALEAGNEFFGERFAGLGPEEAAGDAAVLFYGEGEGEELFNVLLNAFGGVLV
jgi:hypothetical protein